MSNKKKKTQEKSPVNKTKEKKLNRLYGISFLVSLTAFVCYYIIEPKMIGHDIRYDLFIIALPTILGIVLMTVHRRNYLSYYFGPESFFGRLVLGTMLLIFAIMFSYTSFGLIANISWHFINNSVAEDNVEETIYCQVTRFVDSRRFNHSDYIYFLFNNRHESLKISSAGDYINENPSAYKLKLTIQKGIWDLYVVKEKELVKKNW